MTSFFWLTFVASILGLIYAFSRGESDGFDIIKVIIAGGIMLVLVIVWFNTGEDPLDPDPPIVPPNGGINNQPNPNDPRNPDRQQQFWQDYLDKRGDRILPD